MRDWKSQAYVKWECKYYVVIFPEYRKKAIYGRVRRRIDKMLRHLCQQKGVEAECSIEVEHCDPIRYLKGKSSVCAHIELLKRK